MAETIRSKKKDVAPAVPPLPGMERRETLPKTASVCGQMVRCGRPNCRCARGALHGPYACLFWREGGRLRKRYLRLAEAAAVRQECTDRRTAQRELRELMRTSRQQWQRLLTLLWEYERDG